jgi:lysine-specific permease
MKPSNSALRASLDESPPTGTSAKPGGAYRKDLNLLGLITLSLGDTIGSGLLFGFGNALRTAGPASVFVAFLGATFAVFILLASLAEMSIRCPNTGGIAAMCMFYVDSSAGFAIGYNLLISKIAASAGSMQAATSCIHYWLPNVPRFVWGLVIGIWGFAINCLPVRHFSRFQITYLGVELLIVAALTLSVILCVFGVIAPASDPGRFWRDVPFRNGFWGFADAWVILQFAYDGVDDIATSAGEAIETRRNLKRTIYAIFLLLACVYGLNSIFLGFALDPENTEIGDISPFTIVLRSAGVGVAADVVNGVVLFALCGVLLTGSYLQSRLARELGANGRAPSVIGKLTSWGVPVPALGATSAISLALYGFSFFYEDGFSSALELAGVLILLNWMMVSVCLLRYRRAYNNVKDKIASAAYIAPTYPWGHLILIAVSLAVLVLSIGSSFVKGHTMGGVMAIVGPMITCVLYVVHKLWTGSKLLTIREIEDDLLAKDKGPVEESELEL